MKHILTMIAIAITGTSLAQVKDISFTLSPVGQYNWMDKKSGLEDGFYVGGKLGFGFGEYLELRATYLQSMDLKTSFNEFGMSGYNPSLFTSQDILLTQWGGEIKANIGAGKLNPFITMGTGVQNIEIDNGNDFDQIYTSFGLGIKTKLNDRIVFTIEGKNTMYNFNAGKNLLTDADKIAFGVTDADFESELLSNWNALASLQFYLGGRRPGSLTELDKAYLNKLRGGFKGLRWIAEPSMNWVEFDSNSSFRNTWMLGGYLGIDFNEYTGIRAFYLQATNNEQISTDFDKLAMYGLEFRARLNDGNGVTPYLILGGGYMNPSSNYLGANTTTNLEGEEFASAGLGLNIPLGKNLLITGGVRGMVTSSADVQDLSGPDNLQTHMMYNVGLKFAFGAKEDKTKYIVNSKIDTALEEQDSIAKIAMEKKLELQKKVNQEKLKNLKNDYQSKLDSLEVELKNALLKEDTTKAIEILEAKKEINKEIDQVDDVEKTVDNSPRKVTEIKVITKEETTTTQPIKELIKMSPAELELLITKILKETKDDGNRFNNQNGLSNGEIQNLNNRIATIENYLKKDEAFKIQNANQIQYDNNAKVIEMLNELKLQNEILKVKVDNLQNNNTKDDKLIIVNPNAKSEDKVEIINMTNNEEKVIEETEIFEVINDSITEGRFIKNERTSSFSEKLRYKGSSAFLGVNVGGATTANIGYRANYGISNTNLEFMPELYFAAGNPSGFGLSGNIMYPFKALKFNENITPYTGLGAGFMGNDGEVKFNYNIIVGTNLKFLKGRLFVDYTIRNLFKYNQLAIGYRFSF